MDNETLEDKVLNRKQKKSSSSWIFYVIAGLLIIGIVSLYGGIKLFSRLNVSADTDLPPSPPEPRAMLSVSPTSSPDGPPNPPDPTGPTIDVTFPTGWSMIAGKTLSGRDVSPISKQNIFLFSFNDPSPNLALNDWVISDPSKMQQTDYFKVGDRSLYPQPALGYYVFNPNSTSTTVSLGSISPTLENNLIFGRGWHLLYWPGEAATKESLANSISVLYKDADVSNKLQTLISDELHKASLKIYVVVNQDGIANTSVKELTGTDSSTTISKIPAKSYFWIYLRRTKSRAISITVAEPSITPTPTPTATISADLGPPVPPTPAPN